MREFPRSGALLAGVHGRAREPVSVLPSHRIGVDHQRGFAFDSVPVELEAEARPVGALTPLPGVAMDEADRAVTNGYDISDPLHPSRTSQVRSLTDFSKLGRTSWR